MKRQLVVLTAILILTLVPAAVLADPWSAIDSGYAVTTNHHGEEILIPPFPPLQAKVGLLSSNYYYPNGTVRLIKVRVDLRDPKDNVVDTVYVYPGDFLDGTSPQGKPIRYAWTGILEPEPPASWTTGDYSVKAYFYLHDAKNLDSAEDLNAMRATTVMMVIPELPSGTLSAVTVLLGSLGIYQLIKSKKNILVPKLSPITR